MPTIHAVRNSRIPGNKEGNNDDTTCRVISSDNKRVLLAHAIVNYDNVIYYCEQ